MGHNQFQVSVDNDYDHFFDLIHANDASYSSSKTGGPCRKRIVQDAVRVFALLKTRHIQCINIFICEGCHRRKKIDELVRLIENGSNGQEQYYDESD